MGRAPRQSLTSMLIEALTERIQSEQYKPGDQIPTEKDLIEEFNVSRTVVREAIANLKASGLVSTHQGKGAFVLERGACGRSASPRTSSLSPRICSRRWRSASPSNRRRPPWPPAAGRPEQLAAIEAACDAMDAALAQGEETVALDIAFHRAIAEATGNRHFVGLFNYLGEVLMTRARLSVSGAQLSRAPTTPRRCGSSRPASARIIAMIVEAIAAGDSDGARAALRMHLGGSRDRLAARIRA